jgi:hypothetical protein
MATATYRDYRVENTRRINYSNQTEIIKLCGHLAVLSGSACLQAGWRFLSKLEVILIPSCKDSIK